MRTLPAADVVACYFDDGFEPHLAAMRLRWPEELGTNARKICEASAGFPLGVVTAMDRSLILRIRCPEATRWEHL